MQPMNVVIAHGDCLIAESLASSLHSFFQSVAVARSSDELRTLITRKRADVLVVDLETVDLEQVRDICHDFAVPVVTTHRIPDDNMWTSALSVGASDCCEDKDVRKIVKAIDRSVNRRQRLVRAA